MTANLGTVVGIWRFPVKGLRGESLEAAELNENGILGDRAFALRDLETGRIVGAKNYSFSWGDALGLNDVMRLKAEYVDSSDRGELVSVNIVNDDGSSLSSREPGVNAFVSGILHRRLELVEFPPLIPARTGIGRAIHLLTTSSINKMREHAPASDFDARRFRPNILVETTGDGFVEELWPRDAIAMGPDVRLRVTEPNKRCSVTVMKQEELPYDNKILQAIAARNGANLGIVCSVARGGRLRLGDTLTSIE